ncbi:pyridoxal 5 -phosphate synthase-like subunit [Olea europaea subsp. europaea]|uniref:Pyridoxal 5 -phosphate synthase-like subunit n=1 Tax=Olea europaea subsp. europaea TaxID=158383 RepID=A0A8S0V0J6_OLEEU|nr:pyridoxal 5 -phosphate synthase-like subunit [Olea europaea subsp. europaea]
MADPNAVKLYNNAATNGANKRMAEILCGGVIVEVTTAKQAKTAELAGARCISVFDSPKLGISRMPDPFLVKEIMRAVKIPVMAKARVGHFVEAKILESTGVDFIDESEVLAIADEDHFINKHNFRLPFVCGCHELGEALRRVEEGAAMICIQGNMNGTGNIAETVCNTKEKGKLPVVHCAAGGISTPADAALMMQLGCDGVFLGAEVFNSSHPHRRVRAIVQAVQNYNDPRMLKKLSSELKNAMAETVGLDINEIRDDYFRA